jgi:cell division topological specificity factor
MGILDFLKRRPEPTASVARERLRIIVAQERSTRGAPDYLPLMRNELLEVIKKYVHVQLEDININVERGADHEILELSVTLAGAEPIDEHAGKPRKSGGRKSKGR